MGRKTLCALLWWMSAMTLWATHRHWVVADGLPTAEVRQIIELPNRQMLVNCEGEFCLSNGAGFNAIPCDYRHTFQLKEFAKGYGRLWQGDSLLWLHDFYRVYLFDARTRTFRYDVAQRLDKALMRKLFEGELQRDVPDFRQWQCIDSLGLAKTYGTMTMDSQGGLWIGTRDDGIIYLSPRKERITQLPPDHRLIVIARSYTDSKGRIWRYRADGIECEEKGKTFVYDKTNVRGLPYNRSTFIQQLPDGRFILCDSLSTLGYFFPEKRLFVELNKKLHNLKNYRHFVGACPVDRQWTVVYAQNGAFMLDIKADTVAEFLPAREIERFTTKYNCMLRDHEGKLWIGTQSGLFVCEVAQLKESGAVRRIEGLRNNCIRSLILDRNGRVWAGTSNGISRITPNLVNLGNEDGMPSVSTMERAVCMTESGRLVFALGGSSAVWFSPDSVIGEESTLPVVITAFKANGRDIGLQQVELAHDQSHLTFQFSNLDYVAPSHSLYRYRLLPLEKEWNLINDGGGQGEADYMTLPPGNYQFEVQASTSAGQWGEATVVEIEILPPLWLTWWAKTLYVLLGLAAVLLAGHLYLKRRKSQLEQKNDERVNRLFELRDKARHQFAQAAKIDPEKISANKEEEELVEKMLKAIEKNMDNIDYTVDDMASDIAMSRASIYKKTQQMLGITPNEFLRNVRLKHAAHLLDETNEPVNRISLMVGFQTSRYFSQCFRQMFGMTPSEYRAHKNGNTAETTRL